MYSLAGSQAVDQSICCFGPELQGTSGAALGLSRAAGQSAALGLCRGQLASAPGVHPPEVSGVGPQSANLSVCNQASGEHWGCLSRIHSPGAEGGGAPEVAAVESSLTSP